MGKLLSEVSVICPKSQEKSSPDCGEETAESCRKRQPELVSGISKGIHYPKASLSGIIIIRAGEQWLEHVF
jgi:hypothetical protein